MLDTPAHTHYSFGHVTRRLPLKPQGTLRNTNLMPGLHQVPKKQLPGRQAGRQALGLSGNCLEVETALSKSVCEQQKGAACP